MDCDFSGRFGVRFDSVVGRLTPFLAGLIGEISLFDAVYGYSGCGAARCTDSKTLVSDRSRMHGYDYRHSYNALLKSNGPLFVFFACFNISSCMISRPVSDELSQLYRCFNQYTIGSIRV